MRIINNLYLRISFKKICEFILSKIEKKIPLLLLYKDCFKIKSMDQ